VSEEAERFRPTNGKAMGFIGLSVCAAVAIAVVASAPAHAAIIAVLACALPGVLIWAAMLRPRVSASEDHLEMRTLFETVTIPLASIESVVVRRYLLVRSGGNRYICPAISRSLRKTVRSEMRWSGGSRMFSPDVGRDGLGTMATDVKDNDMAYPDFVETRIAGLAESARQRHHIEARSEEEYALGSEVVRRTAWPVIAILLVLTAALVVAVVV
jgi:hypothetical protein